MRVILVNKFYYNRGGDCIYTLRLESLLKRNGHEVAIFSMQHKENFVNRYSDYWVSNIDFNNKNPKDIIRSVSRPLYSREVINKFNKLLNDFLPDVVHLNNVHTHISPIISNIAQKRKIPIIWTLHDYKLICPNYLFYRDEEVCELCSENLRSVIKMKCIKKNLLGSMLAYWESKKWNRNILENNTNIFISPSKFLKNKMMDSGFVSNKIVQIYNSISFTDIDKKKLVEDHLKSDYYVYFGRLTKEKGIETLLNAACMLKDFKLKIFGSGPLEEKLKKQFNYEHIQFYGHKSWAELKVELLNAKFFVIPSEWYENNPLSIIEAFSLGLPGIGSRIGGIPELIQNNFTGLLFAPKNVSELSEKIEELFNSNNLETFVLNAFTFSRQFGEDEYYEKLLSLYKQVQKNRGIKIGFNNNINLSM